jgi:DNA-binding transcriptional ArsR family regulator
MKEKLFSKLSDFLSNIDLRIILILFFIAVSTGHVGRLFADREAQGQEFLGYVLAFAVDIALAISLYEIGYAQERIHRIMALIGFFVACGISGGFNIYYYREFYSDDPIPLSVLLGLAAPVLAAFFALLKARGDVERQESETKLALEMKESNNALELRKLELELETKKAIAVETEKEKTKQERELTKRLKMEAEVEAKARQAAETKAQQLERQRKEFTKLGKSGEILLIIKETPEITREGLGQRVGIGLRTVDYHTSKLEKAGAISRNGQGFRILWDESIIERGTIP